MSVLVLPVLQEGVDHAAVDDGEDQPHQHGHDVLGESISKAVFVLGHSAPCQHGGPVTQQQVQRGRRGGVEEHLVHWKDMRRGTSAAFVYALESGMFDIKFNTKSRSWKTNKHTKDQRKGLILFI